MGSAQVVVCGVLRDGPVGYLGAMLVTSSFLAAVAVGALIAIAAQQSPAAAQTFDIKKPEVEKGVLEYGPETMFARGVPHALGSDVNRHANEQTLLYGIADWWKISGALKLEKPEQDEFRLAGAAIANLFVLKPLSEERANDFGIGLFTEVTASTHSATTNAVVFGPVLTLKFDKLSFTTNPFLEQTFGRNHEEGIALSYGWQLKYDVRDGFGVGVEGFGVVDDLGNAPPWSEQEHRVGPVIFTEIPIRSDYKIVADAGLLFGLTPATPDVALKLNFGVPLYQPPAKPK